MAIVIRKKPANHLRAQGFLSDYYFATQYFAVRMNWAV